MKALLLLTVAIIGISATSSAQGDLLVGRREWQVTNLPLQGSQIVYEESVTVGMPMSGTQLFNNAVEWYSYNYKTGDTRLTVENQGKGQISGTGVIKYTPAAVGEASERPIFFNFDIVVNDGGYTYRIYDMYSTEPNGRFSYADMYREEQYPESSSKPRWEKRYRYEMLSDMDTYIRLMITHLKQSMQKA